MSEQVFDNGRGIGKLDRTFTIGLGGSGLGNRVLLVEDEINIFEAISFILSRDGWEVSGHGNGATALEEIARLKPDVLVLDEPTVGLDIESRAAIWTVLRQLRDQGTTVLLSSHYLEEVDALADQLAIIEGGRVIASGPPSELKAALGGDRVTLRIREFSDEPEALRVQQLLQACPGVRQVVVNRAQGFSLNLVVENDGVVEQLRRQLAEAQLPVFALAQSRPSLDDVYLQATGRTLMDAELAVAGVRDAKAERKQSMR